MVVEQCRKLITTHQFNNEALRILLASLASGLRPMDSFILSTLQKHLLRELRIHDAAVKNPDALKWVPFSKRYALTGGKAGEGDDVAEEEEEVAVDVEQVTPASGRQNPPMTRLLTKNNPIPLAVYGQISVGVKSYQTAICTFPAQISIFCDLLSGYFRLSSASV